MYIEFEESLLTLQTAKQGLMVTMDTAYNQLFQNEMPVSRDDNETLEKRIVIRTHLRLPAWTTSYQLV